MPTLLLPPRYTSDSNRIWKAALDGNWDVERLQQWRVSAELRDSLRGREVALYGEPLFAAAVAEQLELTLLEPTLDWPAQLPRELRARDIAFMTLAEARSHRKTAFIKPAGDKAFEARVYESGAMLPDLAGLDEATPVLVAEPVTWEVEFRCFVLDGEVLTLSPYWRDGRSVETEAGTWPWAAQEEDAAREFAQYVLSAQRATLPPAIVLDVGVIAGRGPAVVEANAAWGSGLYGCDATLALKVIGGACWRRDTLLP